MAVPSFVGSNTQDSAGALSLTFTVPAATTTDDFILVFVKQCENTTQRIWDDDGGNGNGYTRIAYNHTTGGRDQETAVYYKFATSGSEANPTFTWATGITTEPMSGAMLVYRGVDTVSPYTEITWQWAQNDANPPNPNVRIDYANTRVVCCHNATHDDISTVAAPTGFTLRTQVWNGTSNDHRNHFTADIERDTVEDYSPPDWQHSVLNTTPEYQCYSIGLNEGQPIHVTGGTILSGFNWGDTNKTVTGDGFGATQGGGKVEIWSDTSGTIKTTQTIDSWSDTSIQFDTVQGSLSTDTVVYIVVTNNSSEESAPSSGEVIVGLIPYDDALASLDPDHKWTLQNTNADSGNVGGSPTGNAGSTGTPVFVTSVKLCDGDTHSLQLNSITDRSEYADSTAVNIATATARTMGGWIQLSGIQHSLSCIYEEGGGVNNIAFYSGFGNKLVASFADTSNDNAQAFSDFALAVDRPYHIMFRFDYDDTTPEFRLYIDGIKQTSTDGNPLADSDLDSHSGDCGFGDPDGNLEVGGTDVAFDGQSECYYSRWATWHNSGYGALAETTEIRDICFRRGAAPKNTLSSGTEAAMQTALEALDETRTDWPLSLRIPAKTSGGDFELTLEDSSGNPWTFEDRITSHVEFRGSDTLTLVRPTGCNLDSVKCWSANSGTIIVVDRVDLTITVLDIDTSAVIVGARIRLEAGATGPETEGDVLLAGITNGSGILSGTYRFSSTQSVVGRVRKGSSSTYYKTADIVDSITSAGLDITVFMIKDE